MFDLKRWCVLFCLVCVLSLAWVACSDTDEGDENLNETIDGDTEPSDGDTPTEDGDETVSDGDDDPVADGDDDPVSDGDETVSDGDEEETPVLHIGIMVHLEGYDLTTDEAYNRYKEKIVNLASLFEEYDAKLTLEVKEPIQACEQREDYYFKILENRGHGIGVHADAGGQPGPDETWQDMSFFMEQMKTTLEKQDVSVRHVSGYCSPLDWVSAVVEAGYQMVSGGVAYCLMNLPEEEIPEAFRDCQNPAECHDTYPTDMLERMHPWTIKRGESWLENHPDGELVYLPSAIEGLPYLSEMEETGSDTGGNVQFDEGDIEVYLEKLDYALQNLDPDQPNFAYVAWSFGKEMPETFARNWLGAIQPYVESGQVEWKTIPEMYDIFVEWRDSRR